MKGLDRKEAGGRRLLEASHEATTKLFCARVPARRRDAVARGGQLVLDEPVSGARGTHGAACRCGTCSFGSISRRKRALGAGDFCWKRCGRRRLQGPIDPTRLVDTLVFSRKNSSSIVSCIATARENLRHVREQCSSEMWEQLNRLYLEVMDARPEEAWMLKSHGFFRAVQEGAHLFQGITDATMSHGEGWQYIQLGRYVERDGYAGVVDGDAFQAYWRRPARTKLSKARNIWSGWDCCGLAWPLRRIARRIRPRYGPCASRNSCC